jgi:hypothetical protein
VAAGRRLGAFATAALLGSAQLVVHATQAITGTARTVLAAVVTGQGTPVVDVGVDDFVVTEGGAAREVLDVHVADYPLAVILDDREPSSAALAAIRRAARRFVERVGERPVVLVGLSGGTRASLDLSREQLLDSIEALSATSVAGAAPLEVIAEAASLLRASGAPFSAVVVIAGGSVDASAPVRGELLPAILESGATVHVVQSRGASDPVDDDLLRVVASQTRGQFTPIFSTASYDIALDRLADRLAIEMMVQYIVPPGPRAGDVQVGVRKPGARVIGLGVR